MSKVRVAFLGTGGIAGKHVRSMKANKDVEIVAGCDLSEQIVEKFFEKTLDGDGAAPPAFADPAEMYAKVKPDAVVICTPHTLHFEHGMGALEAGCHVLMEKPMVTAADHAYKMKSKVEETGKVFVIGFNTACSPYFYYLREQIRSGAFGKLELVNGYLAQGWMKPTAGSWRQDPKLSGGGQAYDSGAHMFNSLCWSVESRVAEVFAFIDNCGAPVDINSCMAIRFENGVLASIVIGGNCASGGANMAFIFENGRVEIDGWGGGWIKVFEPGSKAAADPVTEKALDPADNFIDAILGRDEPRTNPQNGLVHTELMDAIYESARTGKPARPKSGSA